MAADTRSRPTSTLSPDLLLPELFRAHPEARAIFDRHGLHGCGGRDGPYESIRTFARAHGVDEAGLLAELERAVAAPAPEPPAPAPDLPAIEDTIYRRYFLGAIALALTAGATWGAWILWTIGLGGSFQGVSPHRVNAHGEAQVFGWVGLFIMGFAYQAFPRFWGTTLVAPRLAARSFLLMVVGLVLRTVGIASAGAWSAALPLAMAGGALEIAAVMIFAAQLVATFRRSGAAADPPLAFIMAALACFAASSLVSVWHTWNTMTARTAEELAWYIATDQAVLRDLQIHGLALLMILGVALRMLPAIFDLPRIADRRAWWALDLIVTALVGEVALSLASGWTGNPAFAACLPLAWGVLTAGVLLIVVPWRPWRPFPTSDRSAKFVRASLVWLLVSLAMLLSLPAYQRLSGLTSGHAYHGAVRHAITVGFVSLMIMGMAAKVVPTLNGIDPRGLSSLWGPFLLVNLGCTLRVALQTLTDWTAGAFPLIGVSGTLEVAGLAWWGVGLARLIGQGMAPGASGPPADTPAPERIEPGHRVAEVLDWFPETLPVFERSGYSLLRQPRLRRTLARQVTIERAAALRGVETAALIESLNAAIAGRRHSQSVG